MVSLWLLLVLGLTIPATIITTVMGIMDTITVIAMATTITVITTAIIIAVTDLVRAHGGHLIRRPPSRMQLL